MGVFDFLKKSGQNDDDSGDQGQVSPPITTQTQPVSDVQASYGSFFGNSKQASTSYPLPTAGAPLAPNYGAGVQPADDTTTTTTTTTTDDDDLDITNPNYVAKPAPIALENDPMYAKSNTPVYETQSALSQIENIEPNLDVPAQVTPALDTKVDSLDLENTKLDFNAELPVTEVPAQAPETSVTETATEVPQQAPAALTSTLPATQTEASGNDTETPTSQGDDFNPPIDSLVFNNEGAEVKGNWNPQNAFMTAGNDGVSNTDESESLGMQPLPTPDVAPISDIPVTESVEPIVPEVTPISEEKLEEKVVETPATPEASTDWLKDFEVPADALVKPEEPVADVPEAEIPSDTADTPETNDSKANIPEEIPDWMKEFESLNLSGKSEDTPESAKPDLMAATADVINPADSIAITPEVTPISDEKVEEKVEDTPVEIDTPETVVDDVAMDEEKAPEIEVASSTTLQLKYFRDIALIGLNSEVSDTAYVSQVRSLVSSLKQSATRIIVDSSQGYGKEVLNELKDAQNLEVNGAYLRPYFSAYSDEPNGEIVDVKNYTETLFSNFIERLRYIYSSAELFIVLDSKGLVNLADISFLLAMQKMYYGKHKPVILFGAMWEAKMNTLNAMLNDDEKEKVYVVKDMNALADVLKKIEEGYTKNNFYSTKRVTDLRDIEDEKQFMI